MHKLVILIEPLEDDRLFEEAWPRFLHLVEALPGLLKETNSTVDVFLYGRTRYTQIHELYFDTLDAAQSALTTPEGQAAGQLLQGITGGRLALFFADHKEDVPENLRNYQ